MLSKEAFAKKLTMMFPEKKILLIKYYGDYDELLGHIFFSLQLSSPLKDLIENDGDKDRIKQYCSFIEEMWKTGNEDVPNILCVSILEQLSEKGKVWKHMVTLISKDFVSFINTDLLINNIMMRNVPEL